MSLIADVSLHDDLLLFGETFKQVPQSECLFEDVHYVTTEAGETYYVFFWWTANCDFSEFESALEADSTADRFRSITDLSGRRLYRVVSTQFAPVLRLLFGRQNDARSTSPLERDAPTDEGQFDQLLGALLRAAHENDIDVQGSWDCRNESPYPDWDVTIVEITKRSRGD